MSLPTERTKVHEIEAFSGKYVDYLNPLPEQIELVDIARGLSNICRFAGQVNRFYSVAEHSVYVAHLVEQRPTRLDQNFDVLALAALFHDAHEAYLGDWTSPLKWVIKERAPGLYEELKDGLDRAIGTALGIQAVYFQSLIIKKADTEAMFREASALKYSHGLGEHWGNDEYHVPLTGIGWTPERAEREFLATYERLTNAT